MSPLGSQLMPDRGMGESYRVFGARFHALAILCCLVAINAFIWVALSSLIQESSRFYSTGPSAIDAIALTYQITYIPGTLLSYVAMERYGLRVTVLLGGALTAVASVLRALSCVVPSGGVEGARYAVLCLGTTLAGLAQPSLLNVPAQLAGNWFPPHERDLVTVLGTMFSPVGSALGIALPPLWVTSSSPQEASQEAPQGTPVHGMGRFMTGQALVACVALLWAYLCLHSHPPTPPSASTERRQGYQAAHGGDTAHTHTHGSWRATLQEVWRETRCLLRDGPFRLLLWCFGLGLALFNALLTVLSQLLRPCGYSEEQSGTLGAVFLGSGLVGSLVAGLVLDCSHAYRVLLKLGFVLAGLGMLLLILLQRPDAFGPLAGAFAFLGSAMLPLLPISIETGVECSYPVPEIYSSGLLLAAGNTVGIPLTFLYAYLIESDSGPCTRLAKPANLYVLGILLATVLPIFAYQGPYRRLEAEASSVTGGLQSALLGSDMGDGENDSLRIPAPATAAEE